MIDPSILPIPPFETESDLWEAALNCLLDLRKFRGQCFYRPDHEAADSLIKTFCLKLRECPRWLSLPRIQRDCHLHDAGVIVICQVLATHWQMPRMPTTLQQIGVLAYGFQPPALERFRMDVYREGPVGKFLQIEQRHQYTIAHPSVLLLSLIRRDPIPSALNQVIQSLPTTPDSRDHQHRRKRK